MKVSTHKAVVAHRVARLEASLDSKDATIERLCRERDQFAQANHRQAYCIQQCAAILGPDFSATVDGLPKGVRHVADRLAAHESREARRMAGREKATQVAAEKRRAARESVS